MQIPESANLLRLTLNIGIKEGADLKSRTPKCFTDLSNRFAGAVRMLVFRMLSGVQL